MRAGEVSSERAMHASGELCVISGGRGVHAGASRRDVRCAWPGGMVITRARGGQASSFAGERPRSKPCVVGWLLLLGLCMFGSWSTGFAGLGSWTRFYSLLLSPDNGPQNRSNGP